MKHKKIFYFMLILQTLYTASAPLNPKTKSTRSFNLEEIIAIDQQTHQWASEHMPHLSCDEHMLLANILHSSAETAYLNYQLNQYNDVLLAHMSEFRNDLIASHYHADTVNTMERMLYLITQLAPTFEQAYEHWKSVEEYTQTYCTEHATASLIKAISTLHKLGLQTLSTSAIHEHDMVQEIKEEASQFVEEEKQALSFFSREIETIKKMESSQTLDAIGALYSLTKSHAEHAWKGIILELYTGVIQRSLIATGSYFYQAAYQAVYEWIEAHGDPKKLTTLVTIDGALTNDDSKPLPHPSDERGLLIASLLKTEGL